MYPDQDGRFSLPPNLVGRDRAISEIRAAGGDRVAIYGIESHLGVPVYVHAKVCVIDDIWARSARTTSTAGPGRTTRSSARRCWTGPGPREPRDPAGLGDGARTYARDLRLLLMGEHLDPRPRPRPRQ